MSYQSNYDTIAREHIAHWRKTGGNPFQEQSRVDQFNAATVELALAHSSAKDRVLDVGCGMGDLLAALPERKLFGCDISRDYLHIAAQRGIFTTECYAEEMPFPARSFDLVLSTDVLEHVLDLNAAVSEMLRVLCGGGVLIVRVPDSEDLSEYLDCAYEFVHLRRFDEPTLRLLFGKVFDCEVLDCPRVLSEIHAVVRK